MILDAQQQFSDAQALTATADSTNYIDFGVDRDMGKGEPLAVVITVDTAADSTTGDETYAFAIETDDNTSFSSATTLVSRTIAAASLTAGSRHVIPLGYTNERYAQLVYTLGGTTPSVTVTAFLQPMSMIDSNDVYYADGFTIS